jgi:hypothetical protein
MLRVVAMTRIVLAIALTIACFAAALGAQEKAKENASGSHRTKAATGVFVPHSKKLKDALGGWNRGDPDDPYWDPCLSYSRDWGPGACGGH